MLGKVLGVAGQNDPRYLVAFQHVEILHLFVHIQVGYTQKQLVAAGAHMPLHAVDHRAEEEVLRRGHDQPDEAALLLDERLGQLVGVVVQLLHGRQNLGASLFTHVDPVVQHPGNGGHRHAGKARHIF